MYANLQAFGHTLEYREITYEGRERPSAEAVLILFNGLLTQIFSWQLQFIRRNRRGLMVLVKRRHHMQSLISIQTFGRPISCIHGQLYLPAWVLQLAPCVCMCFVSDNTSMDIAMISVCLYVFRL